MDVHPSGIHFTSLTYVSIQIEQIKKGWRLLSNILLELFKGHL